MYIIKWYKDKVQLLDHCLTAPSLNIYLYYFERVGVQTTIYHYASYFFSDTLLQKRYHLMTRDGSSPRPLHLQKIVLGQHFIRWHKSCPTSNWTSFQALVCESCFLIYLVSLPVLSWWSVLVVIDKDMERTMKVWCRVMSQWGPITTPSPR